MENLTLSQKVLDFIQVSNAIAETAEKQASEKAAQDAQINERIPDVVEALVANGRIEPGMREKAASLLKDPIKALEILKNTAYHRSETELNKIGELHEPQRTKKATVRGDIDSPYCGYKTTQKKASDLAFEKAVLGRELNN